MYKVSNFSSLFAKEPVSEQLVFQWKDEIVWYADLSWVSVYWHLTGISVNLTVTNMESK